MNPDGMILGNYQTNLSGCGFSNGLDWVNPHPSLQKEILQLIDFMNDLKELHCFMDIQSTPDFPAKPLLIKLKNQNKEIQI